MSHQDQASFMPPMPFSDHRWKVADDPRVIQVPASQTGKLCWKCNRINFIDIFRLRAEALGVRGNTPVSDARSGFARGCTLCSMAANSLSLLLDEWRPDSRAPSAWHLSATSRYGASDVSTACDRLPWGKVVITAVWGPPEKHLWPNEIDVLLGGDLMVPLLRSHGRMLANTSTPYLSGQIVKPFLDRKTFDLMRSWLGLAKLRRTNPVGQEFLCQFMDCESRKIVLQPYSVSYLALSYVWGQVTTAWPLDRQDGNSTLQKGSLPQSIEDAITVTLRLREKYLWVDRYCIPHNPDEKHKHIARMNLIYRNAKATLVAINSGVDDSANAGLFGISRPREIVNQLHFKYRTLTVVSTMPGVVYHIEESQWATRGWTYQEAILSRACLFFTANQVHFVTNDTSRCESIVSRSRSQPHRKSDSISLSLDLTSHILPRKHISIDGINPTDSHQHHIKLYTYRRLTYATDRLNAFRGLLASFSDLTYWAIRLGSRNGSTWRWDRQNARNLLWYRKTSHESSFITQRLPDFPTWSWTSVNTSIGFVSPDEQDFRAGIAVAGIEVDSHDGRVAPQRERLISDTGAIAEDSLALDIHGPVIIVRFVQKDAIETENRTWCVTGFHSVDEQSSTSFSCKRTQVFLDVPGERPLLAEARVAALPALFITGFDYRKRPTLILLNEQYTKRVGMMLLDWNMDEDEERSMLRWLQRKAITMTVTLT